MCLMKIKTLQILNPNIEITPELVNIVNARIKMFIKIQRMYWDAGLPAPGDAACIVNSEAKSIIKSAIVMDWAKGYIAIGPAMACGLDSDAGVHVSGWDERINTISLKNIEWTGRTVLQNMFIILEPMLELNFTVPVRMYIAIK